MRILVSGGGTAGHITPILATVDALKSHDKSVEVLYVGQKGSMESRIATGAGLQFAAISAGKLRRYADHSLLDKLRDLPTVALNARDLGRVVKGLAQSLKLLRQFDPDVVFIKGGYVGLPVGLAAAILRIPYVIHESDMRPGLTNRILSKRAAQIAVGFPAKLYKDWHASKLVYVGNPVRRELLGVHRLEGLAKFKLVADLPVILVFCGSQGSQVINKVVLASLAELTGRYQIIHVTGERNIEDVRFQVGRLELAYPQRYRAFSFLTDTMGAALAAADLVVGRGGATTLTELALLSKPAIIIPHSGLDDQVLSATTLSRAGAIKVIPQGRLTVASLVSQIDQVLGSEEVQQELGRAIAGFALADADRRLAGLIVVAAKQRTKPEQKPEDNDGS